MAFAEPMFAFIEIDFILPIWKRIFCSDFNYFSLNTPVLAK